MKDLNPLQDLHETITQQIIEERNREMAELVAEKRRIAQSAQGRYQAGIKAVGAMGIQTSNIDALNLELSASVDEELLSIEKQMEEQSQQAFPVAGLDVDRALLPDGAKMLTPSWVAAFSDDDVEDKLTDSSLVAPQSLLSSGCDRNYFNRAKGNGSGLFGTGDGKIQSWVDFGFWFKPEANRFYNIRPQFRLRGYIIVTSDNGVFTSKRADVLAIAKTNVYQYSWKGWNDVILFDVGGGNINVSRRMDMDRHTDNIYLLGANDWAYIRCTIGLYAYARGSGSHAKNDFSSGAANYLCVPHCHVF